MANYQKLYTLLFNSITDALECLERYEFLEAKNILIDAQQTAEEEYMSEE